MRMTKKATNELRMILQTLYDPIELDIPTRVLVESKLASFIVDNGYQKRTK